MEMRLRRGFEMHRREFLQHVGTGIGGLAVTASVTGGAAKSSAAEPAVGKLTRPVPFEVIQRSGFDPQHAHDHEPGGPRLGFVDVIIEGEFPDVPQAEWQYRTVALAEAFGATVDWTKFDHQIKDKTFRGLVKIAAGGWFRLEVRAVRGETVLAAASVEPIGVGDVFVVAGQSYAEGANDELLKVEDPHGRVAAFDRIQGTWRVAHDPQPNINDGGTIWPALGNLLLPVARVPIGFVNVAVGGTASRQWLPGEPLFENLVLAGKAIGPFRAVLWQQGESDVIERITTEKYVANVTAIHAALAKIWSHSPPWLLAKSTLHPTVYNRPEDEGRIRAAIDELCKRPGFRPGPDTDILAGENRGGIGSRRHFTGIGQRRAALLWFAAVWNELQMA
jgi:hypothetical protein